MIELARTLGYAYVLIAADVLVFRAWGWAFDVTMWRHVQECPEHEDWVPRWSGGWLPAVVADVAHTVLWPIAAVDTVATWWKGRKR